MLRWLTGAPHTVWEAIDVVASIMTMVCFVVLCVSGLWSSDPPRPLYIRVVAVLGVTSLVVRAMATALPLYARHRSRQTVPPSPP